MVITDIQLYELQIAKFGKDEARALTEWVEAKVEKQWNEKSSALATKADFANDIASVRFEMREMEVRLARNIFIATVVQFLAIVGSVLMLTKFHIN